MDHCAENLSMWLLGIETNLMAYNQSNHNLVLDLYLVKSYNTAYSLSGFKW